MPGDSAPAVAGGRIATGCLAGQGAARCGQAGARRCLLAAAALTALAACNPARAQEAGSASGGATGGSDQGSSAGQGAGQDGLQGGSLTGSGVPAVPPIAGGLLPATGADPASPDLQDRLLNAFGQNSQPIPANSSHAPGWVFTPSIAASESLTDNANQFGGFNYGLNHHHDDAVTQITPQILVAGNGERFQVNLDYAPTGVIYAVDPEESQFRQTGSGSILAIAVPDLAFVDLRGNVSQTPVFGGVGTINTGLLPPSQRETQSDLSATPYLVHSFGGTGTAQAGIGYIYSATDAPSYLNNTGAAVPLPLPFDYGSQWLATKRVFASFTTGQDFGRFQDALNTDNSFYDGSGASRGAHRVLVTDDVSYAINRFIAALGEIGYENLDYPRSFYRYDGGVWSLGARITPNAQSSFTVEYRHIDGITTPYVYGYWQFTPRLRAYGSYSAGVTTFQQDQQNGLLSGTEDATGAAASTLLAAPLLNNASLFGANQALTREERADFNLSYLAGRNTVTATYNHQRSSIIGNLLGLPPSILASLGIGTNQLAQFGLLTTNTSEGTNAAVTWRHEWQPDLSSDALIGYNRNHVAATTFGVYDSVQFSAGLNKTFSQTLSGRVAYVGSRAIDGTGPGNGDQDSDTLVFSLNKTF